MKQAIAIRVDLGGERVVADDMGLVNRFRTVRNRFCPGAGVFARRRARSDWRKRGEFRELLNLYQKYMPSPRARWHLAPVRSRYGDKLDEARAWSGWFCRVTGLFLDRDAIEIGRWYWAEWKRIVDGDRRALLVGGDGEGLLND